MDKVGADPRVRPQFGLNFGQAQGPAPTKVFIGLGSNMGNRKQNILRTLDMLTLAQGIRVGTLSTLVETTPMGPLRDQPDFLNGVVEIDTVLSPVELLNQLLSIEARLGRIRSQRWGPRVIDVDILYFGNVKINTPKLKIPHPEILNRPFVCDSLRELRCPYGPRLSYPSRVRTRPMNEKGKGTPG